MTLLESGQQLAGDIALWLQALDDPAMPLAEMGRLSLELGEGLRGLAIIALLAKGDVNKFHHNLIRSARCRLAFLERVHREGELAQHDFVAGCAEPLLDAIAADDLDDARRIADLVPPAFRPGHEYEDDFWFAQLLHRLVDSPGGTPAALNACTRLRALGGSAARARADAGEAIAGTDPVAFGVAFEAVLAERELRLREEEARGELESPAVLARRNVDIEALAWLRLAQRAGLPTDADYRFCPALARRPMTEPLLDD